MLLSIFYYKIISSLSFIKELVRKKQQQRCFKQKNEESSGALRFSDHREKFCNVGYLI